MRGSDESIGPMFVYVTTDQFVTKHHPLRTLKPLVDSALSKLDREFDTLYASTGRPSIPPEYLLRGLVLQFQYSIRSFGPGWWPVLAGFPFLDLCPEWLTRMPQHYDYSRTGKRAAPDNQEKSFTTTGAFRQTAGPVETVLIIA